MSEPWPAVLLGDVLNLDFDRVAVEKGKSYEMVGVYSFGKGLFKRETISKTSYKHFYRLKADHVVMSQLFGWEGALALSSEEFEGRYVSPQFPTFTCDERKLDRQFLGWVIRRSALWDELGKRTKGMGDRRRTLNPQALLGLDIPLPPLSEQQRIVERLEHLASKIEEARWLRQKVSTELTALPRAVIFQDNAEAEMVPMSDLVRLKAPDVTVQAHEIYSFAGVYSFGRGVFRGGSKKGDSFKYPKLTRVSAGNFTYPKLMAWEGALGVVPPDADGLVVSTEFPVFEVNTDRVFPEVLDTYFRTPSVWPSLAEASAGTNVRRRRLHPSNFMKLLFPLPCKEVQLQHQDVLARSQKALELQAQTRLELDALLPSVLDKAFRGEL